MDIAKSVKFMVDTAKDDTHGYAQDKRYGPDYDCSSLLALALIKGGFNIKATSYTGDLYKQLIACGFKECKAPFKSGDIHLTPYNHCCMQVSDTEISEAWCNENGEATKGKQGDQTGKEIRIRKYYELSGGWKYHLRYEPEVKKKYLLHLGLFDNEETAKVIQIALENVGYKSYISEFKGE